MATIIQIKRSQTATSAPSLAYGELSYSFEDATRKLWIGDSSSGTTEVVGGRYYTDLFKTTSITDGKNETGKLLMTDSTNGHLLMENSNITGVNALSAAQVTAGDTTDSLVISKSSSTMQLHGGGTNTSVSISPAGTGTLTLLGPISTAGGTNSVKDEDDMTSDSATHLATQQSIKAYVDSQTGAVSSISSTNSSATVTDAALTVDIGANATAMVVGAATTTLKGLDQALVLQSTETTNDVDHSNTSLAFSEVNGTQLASIIGSHDGGSDDTRGKLEIKTNALGGSSPTTALSIDSNQKVRIHGNLEVDGTTTQIDSTTVTVDDPTLMLGGDYGTVTNYTTNHSGTDWTTGKTHIIDSTGGAGTGGKFKVVVGGSAGSETYTVTIEEGGIGYLSTDTLALADPDSTGDNITLTSLTVSTGPGSDDSLERGISFHYHNGTAAKVGFFGMLRSGNVGKFSFIPEATYSNNAYSGSAGTLLNSLEGNVTGDVKAVDGTVLLNSGADLANSTLTVNSVTGTISTGAQPNITSVGTLTAGGIAATTDFAIDTKAGDIKTGGKIILDVDCTGTGADGSLSFGATGGAADAEIYYKDTTGSSGTAEFVITTGEDLLMTADSLKITPDATAAAGQELSFLHDLNAANPSFKMGTGANEQLEISSAFTAKELQSVKINTKTEGATADDGKIEFAVDDKDIFHIGDNGLYGKERDGTSSGTHYTWDNDNDNSTNHYFKWPQLDGFIINGGFF